ncbi:MAG: IPT/TIG domain-containing protein, partial [Silvanigrellales bacterium]|nr:IPT/TIG domain-containing protein [Silvanigrellales bacterium]
MVIGNRGSAIIARSFFLYGFSVVAGCSGAGESKVVFTRSATPTPIATSPSAAKPAKGASPTPEVAATAKAPVDVSVNVTPTASPAGPTEFSLAYASPSLLPLAGGAELSLIGTGFATGLVLRIDGKLCEGLVVSSPSQAKCTTPLLTRVGPKDVVALDLQGRAAALRTGPLLAAATPIVDTLTPVAGTMTGGTPITISGNHFLPGISVRVGPGLCQDVLVASPTFLQCKVPPTETAGAVSVTVTGLDGTSAVKPSAFTYTIPVSSGSGGSGGATPDTKPVLFSVVPANGPPAGGTSVTLTGALFSTGMSIRFGSSACTGVNVVTATQATCTTPAATGSGTVSVSFSTSDGQNAVFPNAFTYDPRPSLTALLPARGPLPGLGRIVLQGGDFRTGVAVQIGNAACTSPRLLSSSSLECFVPSAIAAGGAGSRDVVVSNADSQTATLIGGYVYDPLPTLTTFTPASGTVLGGLTLTLQGTGFLPGALISVGNRPCSSPLVLNATVAQCQLPAGTAAGAVDVVLTNADAQGVTYTGAFTYTSGTSASEPPSVSGVSPSRGTPSGGNTLTLAGANFQAGAVVRVGTGLCSAPTVVNPNQMTCIVPAASAPGNVAVQVTNVDGRSALLPSAYTFDSPPSLSSVAPTAIDIAGGATLTLRGSGFLAGITVTVGATPCTSVVVSASDTLTCTAPALSAGAKNIIASNTDGQAVTLTSAVTYRGPAPTISAIFPTNGRLAGATSITVSGTGFVTGATVSIGGLPCTSVVVGSATSLTCTTAANSAAGAAIVAITNADGQSFYLPSGFTYNALPGISSVSPARSPLAGGLRITLSGSGFLPGATVTVGGAGCTSVAVNTPSSLQCTTPAGGTGTADVVLTNLDTQSATLSQGYRYDAAPTLASLSPTSGPSNGGTTLTVNGTGFQVGATVLVDGALCTQTDVLSSTRILCLTPVSPTGLGAKNLTVTNPDAQISGTSAFTYLPASLALTCTDQAGAFNGTVAAAPCTVSNPQNGTLSYALAGSCTGVSVNASTGAFSGNIPAAGCTATLTVTNTVTSTNSVETKSATFTLTPYISLAWNGAPSLSNSCVLSVPGTTLFGGSATWANGTGSALQKVASTTATQNGLSGTLNNYELGSFLATWNGTSASPTSTGLPISKNLTLTTAMSASLTYQSADASSLTTNSLIGTDVGNGREASPVGCGVSCTLDNRASIAVGGQHVCALDDRGMRCWGRGDKGEIGNSASTSVTTPTDVTYQNTNSRFNNVSGSIGFQSVAMMAIGGCGLLTDNTVMCWGYNGNGALGRGIAGSSYLNSQRVTGLSNVKKLVAGQYHFCALLYDGNVKCWGYNNYGQLGDGTATNRNLPTSVVGLSGVSDLVAGQEHTCAIANGIPYCWGRGNNMQLGQNLAATSYIPVAGTGIANAVAMAASVNASCAVLATGSVNCWGYGGRGALGNNSWTANSGTPVTVIGNSIANIVDIAVAYETFCARNAAGSVWCWGTGTNGQIGNGAYANVNTAQYVTGFGASPAVPAKKLAGSSAHSYAMCLIVDDANNNAVRCWGYASSGHGNGTTTTNIPVTPTGFTGGVDIASAYYYDGTEYTNTCVVKKDKTLWCWGNPTYYSIGNVYLATPTRVRFGANLAVSAGALHSCVVRSDGYVTCWGGNSSGQLGDNTTTDNNVGVMPTLGNNAVATATGSLHSCALFGDKTAKCWGNNNFGQLGNGSIVQSLIPVSVSGLTTATSITAGKNYTCSLTDSGGVTCWGANDAGQLGNGANTYSYTAVAVQDALGGNLANAVNVVAGELHSCALINDGTVKCWGSNDNSQVGDRTTTNRNQATVVTGLTNVVALSLGYNHTCALLSDQTVKCWGANTYGLTSPAFLPVPVRQAAPSRVKRATRFVTESVSLT